MQAIPKVHILAMILLAKAGLPDQARADSVRAVGTVTEVASRIGGKSIVILDFEIPPFRAGTGLEIVSATVEWAHSGISEDTTVRYQGFTRPGVDVRSPDNRTQSENVELALSEEPIVNGVIYPQDYRRTGSGHLRLDVRKDVAQLAGIAGNDFQIMISTADMSPSNLAEAIRAPILVIQYGFLGYMKQALGRGE